MRVLVLTSNAYVHCLAPFAWCWNKYWGAHQPVTVVGYDVAPKQILPPNFVWWSLGKQEDFSWSDGLIHALTHIKDDYVVLFLEDYWLCRRVVLPHVVALADFIMRCPDIGKIDLTDDRLKFAHTDYFIIPVPEPVDFYAVPENYAAANNGRMETIRTIEALQDKTLYKAGGGFKSKLFLTSLQAAIWRKDYLLSLLVAGESAWEFEERGTARAVAQHFLDPTRGRILGTRVPSVEYQIAVKARKPHVIHTEKLSESDIQELKEKAYL